MNIIRVNNTGRFNPFKINFRENLERRKRCTIT
jgi:hypothetical protein